MSGFKIGLADGLKGLLDATEKAALAPHVGGDSESAETAKKRAALLLAAHLYMVSGHLCSGDEGNINDALAALRELADYLKSLKDQG